MVWTRSKKKSQDGKNNNSSSKSRGSNKSKGKETTADNKSHGKNSQDKKSSQDKKPQDKNKPQDTIPRNNKKARSDTNKSKEKKKNKPPPVVTGPEALFTEIADENDENSASMEGIVKLAEKLDIDAFNDIRILVLLYKMGAGKDQPGTIAKDEWMQGCSKLKLDSWTDFGKCLPSLDTGFMEQKEFKEFYKFCFQFNREGTHKTLEKDTVAGLMELVLKGRVSEDRLSSFCGFLASKSAESYTRITTDQWTSFLEFCQQYQDDGDLSKYDESTSSWPVLIDDYVDHMQQE